MPGCGVNFVELQKPLLNKILKWGGLQPELIQIEDGTSIHCWVPRNKTKPPLVLVHGFAAEGAVTWQFQVGALGKEYSVYIPDMLFFGKSFTVRAERSESFQAECLMKMLRKLGVERCAMVGFSYGGMVAFKMAEVYPELVTCLVISGSVMAMTDSISQAQLSRIGFTSSAELLLPSTVKGLKALLSVAAYKKFWFPDCLYRDFLEVMFANREERAELLEALVESTKVAQIPELTQVNEIYDPHGEYSSGGFSYHVVFCIKKILLLWGNNDEVFHVEVAQKMKEQLGDNTQFVSIKKAGHLVHLERPCRYNRHVLEFLSRSYSNLQK